MDLVELRPSYSERLRQSYLVMTMKPEEKQAFLAEQIQIEEEKLEVRKYLEEQ